jgi:hypothetical protein
VAPATPFTQRSRARRPPVTSCSGGRRRAIPHRPRTKLVMLIDKFIEAKR